MKYDVGEDLRKLKRELANAINEQLREFQEATGITPNEIDIRMVDVTSSGDRLRRFIVGDVQVRIEQ